ncbi:MAG TPA: hypothetical protein DCM68_00470 [Verrucomicrobia bacterium]|nr:hypothetical protein [Verrucomicrobiota bacterium]
MKTIHFLLGLVLFLSIAAGGLALIVSPEYPEFIQTAIAWGSGLPDWAKAAAGVGVVLYVFAYLLTGMMWRRRKTFITFENENGTVSVGTDAVQEYLNGLKGEFAAVVWLKSHLRVVRGALEVGLVLGVKDGTQIPELCKLMQTRVRELLEEHLGTCDLRGVSVEVNEIRSRKKPAAEEPA